MPRKNLIRCNHLPYHVTSRSNNKEWFSLPLESVWNICLQSLKEAYNIHKVEIISFVLMSNHYHLIVRTPDANLDQFMYEFNKRIAFALRDSSGNINHILGGRYKWCLIQSQKYFGNCYRYVYQNPRRAMLTHRCEDYPFSTLHFIVNNKNFVVPLFDQMGFKDGYNLNWINDEIDETEKEMLKTALRRSELKVLRNRSTRKEL
ncbi:MAG: transposase [Bacteriovorax sp.]|jgi:putative transposase